MPLDRPDREYAPAPDLAQRWAHRYITRWLTRHAPLTAPHARAIACVKRWAMVWAALAGIVSGTLIGGGEWWMKRIAIDGWSNMSLVEQAPYWIAYFAAAGIITAVEIGFLYWNSLRGVAKVVRLAGLDYARERTLTPPLQLTVHGVARVALEYPSAGNAIYGINPHAYLSGWKLTLKALLYRLKISMSSFLLRLVMRRLLGRLALRGVIPLLMGPLYAVWNAWIAARVLGQAHFLAYGPPRVVRLSAELAPLSQRQRWLIVQGIGELMMRTHHPHPNLVLLLSELLGTLPEKPHQVEIDWDDARKRCAMLETDEQSVVLEALSEAVLLSGPIKGARKAFLQGLYAHCQTPLPERELIARQRRWLAGAEVMPATVASA